MPSLPAPFPAGSPGRQPGVPTAGPGRSPAARRPRRIGGGTTEPARRLAGHLAWPLAWCLAAAGCAAAPARPTPCPPFGGPPAPEPPGGGADWLWLVLALAVGLGLGLVLTWLWRAWRLRQALRRPQGLLLPAEVGSLRAALGLIEDLVLLWQERERKWGGRRNHAPAGNDPAGAVVGGDNDSGARPGGWPPAR